MARATGTLASLGTTWLSLALVLCVVGGCADPAAELVGSWRQVDGSRPGTRLILQADGTGKLEIPGSVNYQLDGWQVETDNQLLLRVFDESFRVRFVHNENSLEISRAEAFDAVNGTYRRQRG